MEDVNDEREFLESLAKGISALFGEKCEVVLHDLKNTSYDKTIVAIENGHVTGRKVGDCGTNLGLEVLRGTDKSGNKFNYSTQTPNGKILRSSTVYVRNRADEVIGALCVNFDITELMIAESALASITNNPLKQSAKSSEVHEVFVNDVEDLLDNLIQESLQHIGKPVVLMDKNDKLEALRYLDRKGAFLVKKAGDRIAKFYDMSKYTMYSYLDQGRTADE